MNQKEIRIVFMGTPDFAVESLKALVENGYLVLGVITAPDKPAGRGRQLSESAVKKYAVENNLKVLQPEKLKNQEFIAELESLKAD
ncbi:MAG: formyltransferase family protein, partial [Bacteroidota bacterium]|nr:formyltransferase family protein [Bacteroidota bacterium]